MSHSFKKTKSRQRDNPKVHFEQYFDNINEPIDNFAHDTPPELEAELLENSQEMRRHFRDRARKLRNLH